MNPGDFVTSKKLGPGIWEVVAVYELTVKVTQNGHTHIRPKDWFTPGAVNDVQRWLTGG